MNVTEIRLKVAAAMGCLLVGSWFGYFIAAHNSHSNAIEQSCAYYDGKTGEFKWGQPQ